jgi:hypothetical protein
MKRTGTLWMMRVAVLAVAAMALGQAVSGAAPKASSTDSKAAEAPFTLSRPLSDARVDELIGELVTPTPSEGPAKAGSAGPDDLKAYYKEAPLAVQFQVETIQSPRDGDTKLPWEIAGPTFEVLKGKLATSAGRITVLVDSPVRAFDMTRDQIKDKQFVILLKPVGAPADRRFQLVGGRAYLASSPEAETLRKLGLTDVDAGSGGNSLLLEIKPMARVFQVNDPKTFEIRLTNRGTDTATYLQEPIFEEGGKLYLVGQGAFLLREIPGNRLLPDKGNVMPGQASPTPHPRALLANQDVTRNIDLARYFDLPAGRYNIALILSSPDGQGRISSNVLTFQVGAVNLPPADSAIEPPPVATTPTRTTAVSPIDLGTPDKPAAPTVNLPDPSKYEAGKPVAGMRGLLRPTKAKYGLGEPIDVELRLINQSPRTSSIDVRMERTLTIQVQELGDSPSPMLLVRQNNWAADPAGALPDERAHLREGSFWGRSMNLNVLYGKTREELIAMARESASLGKEPSYDSAGGTIYGFPKAGYYRIYATYTVARPRAADGKSPADMPKDWWIGELQTNPILVQVGEPGK